MTTGISELPCAGKQSFASLKEALRILALRKKRSMRRRHKQTFDGNLIAYRCSFCSGYHHAHGKQP